MSLRRTLPPDVENEGFDMTPMIDCTFQLIIFFMLVTDMASLRTEALTLPAASRVIDAKNEDDLVVNVMADGKVKVDGRILKDEALESIFEHVQKVMMIATTHGAVTRIQFCAKKE